VSAGIVIAGLDIEAVSRAEVANWFVDGMDHDDLMQEARLAAWISTTTWSPGGGSNQWSWARFVIRKRMMDAVNASKRERRRANTNAVRLDGPAAGDMDITLGETLPSTDADVVDQIERINAPTTAETLRALADRARLSPFERRALEGVVAGLSYVEIGNAKAVDNALQRAKRKLCAT
jgi:DNA-directed RNA polymerase specialized sigma24 family protein